MQIKVTVASVLLAITAINAAPVQEAPQERGFGSMIGKTSSERLNTGLSAAGVGMMANNMFGQQKRQASPQEARAFRDIAGKTSNDRLNTGLQAASTGMLAYNTIDPQHTRRSQDEELEARRLGSFKNLMGKNSNERLQTGLAAGGVGMMGLGAMGQQKRRAAADDVEARGFGSMIGKTSNERLNTGLSAAGVGMMGFNTLNSQKRGDSETVSEAPVSTTSSKEDSGSSNSIFGKDPNSRLNTGLAAAGTGMMAYNLYNSQQQQQQRRGLAEDEVPYVPRGLTDEDVAFVYKRELPIAPIVEGVAEAAEGGATAGEAAEGSSALSKVGDAAALSGGGGGGGSSSGSGGSGSNAATSGAVAQAKGGK